MDDVIINSELSDTMEASKEKNKDVTSNVAGMRANAITVLGALLLIGREVWRRLQRHPISHAYFVITIIIRTVGR